MQRIHSQILKAGIFTGLYLALFLPFSYGKPHKPCKPVYAALAVDAETGQILYQQNADTVTPPASLTKIMTLLMVFDALEQGKLKLTDMLPISRHAAAQLPCKLGLRAGDYISVEHIIFGCVTKSANDAAVVIAEFLGGSESAFAAYMTQRARQFGMKDTTFKTASGMPAAGQITTAKDMALLGIVANKHYKKYFHLFSKSEFCYKNACHINHNYRLLKSKQIKFDGIKTGFVNASGFNVIGSYTNGSGKRVVIVLLGGPSPAWRDKRVVEIAQRLEISRAKHYVVQNANAPVKTHPTPEVSVQPLPPVTKDAMILAKASDEPAPVQEITPSTDETGSYSLLLGYYGSKIRAESLAKEAISQAKLGSNKSVSTKRIRVGGRYLYQSSINNLSKQQVDQASAILGYFNIDSSAVKQPS
jgi:D-alanyl-D-alanine carboxypeptidase